MSDVVSADIPLPRQRIMLLVAASLLGLIAAVAADALLLAPHRVATHVIRISQRNRTFWPGSVMLQPGDTLRIVNDDNPLRHHAYVQSPEFSFDSGDQEPGSVTDIAFPVPGVFRVLCGIHPKMHLEVVVQQPSNLQDPPDERHTELQASH